MNQYDLAWKGTTAEQKRELLTLKLKEREELLKKGNVREAQLGLASACADIIGTAHSALLGTLQSEEQSAWQDLRAEVITISQEAVTLAQNAGMRDWVPSDYEVAGVILLHTANGDEERIRQAIDLFMGGSEIAEQNKNIPMYLLLLSQMVSAAVVMENMHAVGANIRGVHDALLKAEREGVRFEDTVLTRVHGKLAAGEKYLAIAYAEKGGLENQVLKAKSI